MKLPATLFARTVTVIAVASMVFFLFALSIVGYFILVPVGKQSANDLAALMIFSAKTWAKTSTVERSKFEQDMLEKYSLNISENQQVEPVKFKPLPYYYFLESSLESYVGNAVYLKISRDDNGEEWYWAYIPINDRSVYVGFPGSHVNVRPPLVLILLLIVGGLAILVTAAALVRHLTKPLECLTRNALRIGSGEQPELIPETGPEEMLTLAKSFNTMAVQVKELLTNRTTLLAGISHDLRTPLARIQLALEMLPKDADPVIVNGIRGDVEQMNCLIGQFLELSRVLEKGEKQSIEITEILEDLVNCGKRGGANIHWQAHEKCHVLSNPMAVRRIIVNLLENAVRYSEGQTVEVDYACEKDQVMINILDRGPGIPANEREAVFRPFYRLDQSRNTETGGTGLGLSIALQLAKVHKIKIRLYDRTGGGTVAEIKIPNESQT